MIHCPLCFTLFPYTTLFRSLGRVFPARPLPKTGEDGAIYFAEGTATHHAPMIVGPTPYLGVEDQDQFGGGLRQPCAYGFSDVIDRKSTRLNSSHVAISYAVF